jgi:anti-sigma factor RsiW
MRILPPHKMLRFMRDHRWTHAHLSDYLDEELSAPERRRVEEHVGMCPKCRRVLATLRKTLEALRSLGTEPARAGLADTVIARLPEQ